MTILKEQVFKQKKLCGEIYILKVVRNANVKQKTEQENFSKCLAWYFTILSIPEFPLLSHSYT